MSSLAASARGFLGAASAPPKEDDGAGREIESVRELNRLLESALRMGEGDAALGGAEDESSDTTHTRRGGKETSAPSSDAAASWRLDTARRLSSLLTSQITDEDGSAGDSDLISTLRRQSRYWIPLLLSWLKGNGTESADGEGHSLADLPLGKNRRGQRQKNANKASDTPEVQIEALRALTALTEWTRSEMGGEPIVASPVKSNNPQSPAHVTAGCSPHTPLSTSSQRLLLRHSDAVPMIVSLLSSPDAAVHEQAVWILGSIASGGLGGASLPSTAAAEMTKALSKNAGDGLGGTMSVEVNANNMLPNDKLADAINLAASEEEGEGEDEADVPPPRDSRKKDNLSGRDVIFASQGIVPLMNCLADNPDNLHLQRLGAWCLSSLIEGRYSTSTSSDGSKKSQPSAAEELDILTVLPTMRRMLHIDDAEVLTYTCWTLSHLCDGPSYHIAAVIYSETGASQRDLSPMNGLVPRLVELLLHSSPKVSKPALRTVGNIVCADCGADQTDVHGNALPVTDFTEVVLECGAVPCLRMLIGHRNREIQKEACWTLSNIAAGTASQIQAVIDSGAIPPLVEIVNMDETDKEVRSEACWVVLNATSCGNDEQISTLIEEGCVSVLGVLLTEPNMVMMALEGIERVLQTEEARDADDLRHHTEEELGQRPTIIRCAGLVKAVTESPHNSTAVSKRAKRIWDHHFISCALCHNNYSRCRPRDSRFCNECKCHVCSNCDCRVYHLDYQEELWAEDEEKAAETKKSKKNKNKKKKQREKQKQAEKKLAEKKRLEEEQAEEARKRQQREEQSKKDKEAAAKAEAKGDEAKSTPDKGKSAKGGASRSRGTIESNDTGESLGGSGAENNDGGGNAAGALDESTHGGGVDLVSYLQQTGSIIALAKLLDTLYADEDLDGDDLQQQQPLTTQ
ncbi:hypothetical protein ACHAXT_008299 [Thalassiosira profunda]